MKKIVTLILTTCFFYSANAQQLSGGFRTGASYWIDKKDGECVANGAQGQNKTWDKEFFVRYHTKGKFAFEAGMGHYKFAGQTEEGYVCGIGPDNVATISAYNKQTSSQNVEWNVGAQYDISCQALQEKCPLMKRLKTYAGIIVSPTLSRTTTEEVYGDAVRSSSEDSWSFWTGINQTMVYSICDRMYVSSSVRMQINPRDFFNNMEPASSSVRDSRLGLQIGIGYNFQ